MHAIGLARRRASLLIEKTAEDVTRHSPAWLAKGVHTHTMPPTVKSVAVQAGPPSAVSTSSFGTGLASPPVLKGSLASGSHHSTNAATTHNATHGAVHSPHHGRHHGSSSVYERKPSGGLRADTAIRVSSLARHSQRANAHDFGLDVFSLAAAVKSPHAH